MKRATPTFICSLLLPQVGIAQDSALDQRATAEIAIIEDQHPVIDGQLDDKVWDSATQIKDFTEVTPNEGAPASPPTICYLARDNDTLFIAFECFEDDVDSMVLQNLSRDAFLTDDDRVEIVFDTFNNKHSGYLLTPCCLNTGY